jgi:hypothetical protein
MTTIAREQRHSGQQPWRAMLLRPYQVKWAQVTIATQRNKSGGANLFDSCVRSARALQEKKRAGDSLGV